MQVLFYTYFNNRILPDYEKTIQIKLLYANLEGFSVSKGVSLNTDMTFTNGLSINFGATLMDVSITENNLKTTQLLTERFSGVWSISYKTNTNFTFDYTGNIYSPMRLPLLGENDPRAEYSPWFSIQNIQLTKKFTNNWEVYGGVKNLLNFTPAANSINNSENPFEIGIDTEKNPELAFDPSYVYASNQGMRAFVGVRYTLF
jgi:outer membrane receptor for ferrienterochelin and colicins